MRHVLPRTRTAGLPNRLALLLVLSLTSMRPACAANLLEPPPGPPVIAACGAASGGFLLPGTDACLRINGFVRAEATARVTGPIFALRAPSTIVPGQRFGRSLPRPSVTTAARVSADIRIPTAYGPVRLYVSLKSVRGSHQTGLNR